MKETELEKEYENAKSLFVKALINVQRSLKPVKRDTNNPFFKSKYADLESVYESCRELLAENNFAVTQGGVTFAGKNYIRTILHHVGSYSEAFDLPLMDDVSNPQKIVSSLTYYRRAGLAAAVGIVTTGEDHDGNDTHEATEKPRFKSAEEVFKKKPSDTSGDEWQTSEITVNVLKAKPTAKGDMSYSVLSGDGVWYSTFDEEVGATLGKAKESKEKVKIVWKAKGDFKNIAKAALEAEVGF